MTAIRQMQIKDLYRLNNVNLDHFTENFNVNFYLHYLTKWPECCYIAETPDGTITGYMIGKVEGVGPEWHGHVTAVSIAPEFRRTGVARKLMDRLEVISDTFFHCYFVDLYVRASNQPAIDFYKSIGYTVYRVVIGYYGGDEDAYDMRKPLPRDTENGSIRGAGFKIDASQV
jgi:N-terminal acetyltransferase B complex catalytic subunit